MILGQCDEDPLTPQSHQTATIQWRFARNYGDVDRAIPDTAAEPRTRAFNRADLDVWKALSKLDEFRAEIAG